MQGKKLGKILIIDDEPDILETMKSRLDLSGYEVKTAQDGESGIEVAKTENPDMILLDIMMPGIDGFETIKRLKADTRTKKIPIIIFSCGSQEIEWAKRAIELGAVGYVVKPLDAEALLFTMSKFLKKL